jgi:hypothetical protein
MDISGRLAVAHFIKWVFLFCLKPLIMLRERENHFRECRKLVLVIGPFGPYTTLFIHPPSLPLAPGGCTGFTPAPRIISGATILSLLYKIYSCIPVIPRSPAAFSPQSFLFPSIEIDSSRKTVSTGSGSFTSNG